MLDLSTRECRTLSTEWTFQTWKAIVLGFQFSLKAFPPTLGFLFSVSISSSVFLASLLRNWLNAWDEKTQANKYDMDWIWILYLELVDELVNDLPQPLVGQLKVDRGVGGQDVVEELAVVVVALKPLLDSWASLKKKHEELSGHSSEKFGERSQPAPWRRCGGSTAPWVCQGMKIQTEQSTSIQKDALNNTCYLRHENFRRPNDY